MKNKRIKAALLFFGATLFFSNNAFAQAQNRPEGKTPPTFKQLLKEMDADADGKLSKEEIKGPLKDNFSKVDTDGDGFITEEEFKKAPRPKRRERRN